MLTFVSLPFQGHKLSDLPGSDHSCLIEVIITWWQLTNAQIVQTFKWVLLFIFLQNNSPGEKYVKNSIGNSFKVKIDYVYLLWKDLLSFELMEDKD